MRMLSSVGQVALREVVGVTELEIARTKRRAEKRLRSQGLTRKQAERVVSSLPLAAICQLGKPTLIERIKGDA